MFSNSLIACYVPGRMSFEPERDVRPLNTMSRLRLGILYLEVHGT